MTVYGITGASGQLGRLTAQAVGQWADPAQVVLISRSPGELAEYAARGFDVRAGDFDDPASLRTAFAGVDRLLIISTERVGARLDGHRRAVAAATDAGVSHLLYTSIPDPTPENPAGVVPDHAATEAAIRCELPAAARIAVQVGRTAETPLPSSLPSSFFMRSPPPSWPH